MAEEKRDVARMVEEGAKTAGLTIAPEYLPNVILNVERSLDDRAAVARARSRGRSHVGPGVPAMSDPTSKAATATEIAGAVMSGKVKAAAVIDAAAEAHRGGRAHDQRLHRCRD